VRKVLFTAAHSGFPLNDVPLGGGAAVSEQLAREWGRTRPFALEVLGPSLLGSGAPKDMDLVRYSELRYARFCLDFEQCLTQDILKHDPQSTVVLSNDVSEGPDFKRLSTHGFRIWTIYHVDVVDYFTTIYLRSWVRPEWTTAFYDRIARLKLSGMMPDVLKLVWEKQAASVRYSHGLIVPSARMKAVLLRCYPGTPPERIRVLPWGAWDEAVPAEDVRREKDILRSRFPVPAGSWALMTLSRISPEKGQDRLLRALARWEKRPDYPKEGICLFVAGEAAYMMGKKYQTKLEKLATRLKRSRVYFVGYAAGARKKALFELADLYVFPSRHESYGLTLLEALRAGKPVLAAASHGALEVFRPEFGEIVSEGPDAVVEEQLVRSLKRLLVDRSHLEHRGALAAAWAKRQDFSETASKLAALVTSP
jgi:glycosyltransferase involved in cell wall biosynthesis